MIDLHVEVENGKPKDMLGSRRFLVEKYRISRETDHLCRIQKCHKSFQELVNSMSSNRGLVKKSSFIWYLQFKLAGENSEHTIGLVHEETQDSKVDLGIHVAEVMRDLR